MADKIGCIEWSDGRKEWYQNGKLHRTDGPAVEYASGDKWWYKNGELHRTDGPAIERSNGEKEWWLNNIYYSFSEWCEKTNLSREEKCELVLIYG